MKKLENLCRLSIRYYYNDICIYYQVLRLKTLQNCSINLFSVLYSPEPETWSPSHPAFVCALSASCHHDAWALTACHRLRWVCSASGSYGRRVSHFRPHHCLLLRRQHCSDRNDVSHRRRQWIVLLCPCRRVTFCKREFWLPQHKEFVGNGYSSCDFFGCCTYSALCWVAADSMHRFHESLNPGIVFSFSFLNATTWNDTGFVLGVRYSFVSILKLFPVPSGTINSIRISIGSLIHSLPEKIPNNTV